ncbi:ABC transporter permease [Propioniciclava soli]|uniref:ABC transporter permease n=1 Tax=Propioniciclava soli TaxID=2775081 RepID=UPI001E642716|nr:ABC transporter permease [Propioniciclava soli]
MTTATANSKSPSRLISSLMFAELRVFMRQPVMIALTLLLPAGLLGITAVAEVSDQPDVWAQIAGRNVVATQCITVYFVALNTITARRHTLALKRLRTTALPSFGIVAGLLTPPLLVGLFQVTVVLVGLGFLGAPMPDSPLLVTVSALAGMVIAALAGVVTSAFTANPEKAQWTMLPLFVAAMGAVSILPTIGEGMLGVGLRLVPLVANAHLVTAGWIPGDVSGATVATDLGIMASWILVLGVLAWRTFRWERRH